MSIFINNKTVNALNVGMLAYPIGREKDSYYINSWFTQDIETKVIIVEHELVKNFLGPEKKKGVKYKEGVKFRELLLKGTYKQCLYYFQYNVMNTEKEWIKDEKGYEIYPED